MRRRTLILLCLLAIVGGLLGLTGRAAQADTTTVLLERDTYVDKAKPTADNGSATALAMNADTTKTKWAYAQAPALNVIPAGAVTSLTEVIVNPGETDATQQLIVYAQPNCTWSSGAAVNWNNAQTTYPPAAEIGRVTGTTAGVDKVIPVGNYVTGNGAWCVVLKTTFANPRNTNRTVESDNASGNRPVRFRVTYGPAPTTTTAAATTTTTGATTTTAGVTTTTMASTTTTLGSCSPITITTGGTYTGCYQSTSTTTPAVRIQTTQPVILDHATIRHAQYGVRTITDGADVTIIGSTFQRLNPGVPIAGRAINIEQAAKMVIEHNRLLDGDGILMLNDLITPTLGRVRYNEATNIGRYKNGRAELVQFFQANKVVLPGLEIAWNKVTNTFGQSEVEDNINIYQSAGGSGNPIDIHHNLVDGAFPLVASDAGYSGGGILTGDNGSDWTIIHDNWVVKTIQYGVAIYGGHDNHAYSNRTVSNGRVGDDASTMLASANVGLYVWNGDNTVDYGNDDATSNVSGWIQAAGSRNDFWFPNCDPPGSCVGNTSLAGTANAAAEQAERDAWDAARVAAGVTVGPLP